MSWLDLADEAHRDPATPTRYDLVLAIIPAAFLGALLLATVLSLPLRSALVSASVVGAAALVDALFLNPPRGRSPSTTHTQAGR